MSPSTIDIVFLLEHIGIDWRFMPLEWLFIGQNIACSFTISKQRLNSGWILTTRTKANHLIAAHYAANCLSSHACHMLQCKWTCTLNPRAAWWHNIPLLMPRQRSDVAYWSATSRRHGCDVSQTVVTVRDCVTAVYLTSMHAPPFARVRYEYISCIVITCACSCWAFNALVKL